MRIRIYDSAANRATEIDQSPEWIAHAGSGSVPNAVVSRLAMAGLCAADERRGTTRSSCTTRRPRKLHQATTGYLNDTQPVFDPEGKYLF